MPVAPARAEPQQVVAAARPNNVPAVNPPPANLPGFLETVSWGAVGEALGAFVFGILHFAAITNVCSRAMAFYNGEAPTTRADGQLDAAPSDHVKTWWDTTSGKMMFFIGKGLLPLLAELLVVWYFVSSVISGMSSLISGVSSLVSGIAFQVAGVVDELCGPALILFFVGLYVVVNYDPTPVPAKKTRCQCKWRHRGRVVQ